MYKRTFEVLSKYVSKNTDVTIQFDTDGGARADMKKNILHLPKEVAKSHAYAGVSLMMHEAAHIKYSKCIPIKEVIKTKAEFSILNAIEDVRIDLKNFNKLPNIHAFYDELIKEVKENYDKDIPQEAKTLCDAILRLEGFDPKGFFGVKARQGSREIRPNITEGCYLIESKNWSELAKEIQIIKKKLNIQNDPEMTPQEIEQLQMGSGVDGPLGAVEMVMRPDKIFANGQIGMDGPSATETGSIAMDEQCANQFKEILNVKERKIIDNGTLLDTSNLVSFKTGDLDTLFKEEKIVKSKKSKIMFLIDASGSMCGQMIDGNTRSSIVLKSVSTLTSILDEVCALEGLNVDWGVGMFRNIYYPLTKENWKNEYHGSGGTSFKEPFEQLLNEMLNDYTIDGKRIIIAFTDGDVADWEIEQIRELIIRNYSDVRSLVIGVGSDGQSKIVKDITGDNVILAEDNAVQVIMETIKSLI